MYMSIARGAQNRRKEAGTSRVSTRKATTKRALVLSAFWFLACSATLAQSARVVPIYQDAATKLMWYQAEFHGFPPQKMPTRANPPGTQNWTSSEQYLTWDVSVVKGGEYGVSILYQTRKGGAGTEFEVPVGQSKVVGITRETGNAWRKPGWELQPLSGNLKLPAGHNRITLRIVKKSETTTEIMQLRALELIRSPVRTRMESRARNSRAKTDWMVAAKYGIMFHWTVDTQPRRGPQKPYCEAVQAFDVNRFASMVEETGAGYVVFTTSHGRFFFPGPIGRIEKLMPGRTCPRDLPSDLADALARRGTKLILYSGWSTGDDEFAKAFGYRDPEKIDTFNRNISAVLTEIGKRYGRKMAGLFFDGGFETYLYPYNFSFERVTAAARAGNPERVISYNHWIFPKITNFQDYWIGESGGRLAPAPEAGTFQNGGVQDGMQAHLNPFLDDPWVHKTPDKDIREPLHSTEELVDYVRRCVETKTVPSINLGIYQDGTVSDASLQQMRAVRKAIRGQ